MWIFNVDHWYKQLMFLLQQKLGHAALLWWDTGLAWGRKTLLGSRKAVEGSNQKMTTNTNKQNLRSNQEPKMIHTFENVPDVNICLWFFDIFLQKLELYPQTITVSQTKTEDWHTNVWPSVCGAVPPVGPCSIAPVLPHYPQSGRSAEGGYKSSSASKIPCCTYVCKKINNNWPRHHPLCYIWSNTMLERAEAILFHWDLRFTTQVYSWNRGQRKDLLML